MTQPARAPMAGAPFFHDRDGVLHAEEISLRQLAEQFGTPLYVYSRAALRAAWERYQEAASQYGVLICYGMKANSNLAVLREFARLGAGFDIVSGGELARALRAGADPRRIVFSGVGKQDWEITAALKAGVKSFNVESVAELRRISAIAVREDLVAPVSLRVNPDVDARTHPYISTGLKENKFGIAIETAPEAYRLATSLPNLHVVGIDCHIGSQLTDTAPYLDALDKLIDLIDVLAASQIRIAHLDIGGGLGIRYDDEVPPEPESLIRPVLARLKARGHGDIELVMEPGRSLVGNAGVLLTTVQFLKLAEARNFAVVDAGMNDLLRPALYEAWHGITPVVAASDSRATQIYDVVGPVCESADWLGRGRELAIEEGDVLAIGSAGAYGMTMASNYNSRPRPAEIVVDGHHAYVVRQRETFTDLIRGESVLPDTVD